MKHIAFTLIIAAMVPCVSNAQAQQMNAGSKVNFDLNKFAGKWYEITYLQQDAEEQRNNLEDINVTYVLKGDNKFYEEFRANKKRSGKQISALTNLTYKGNGVIKASGGGKCEVIAVDADYQYIMFGTADHKYVWILCRTQHLDPNTYTILLDQAANLGFATDQPGLMAGR